MAGEVEAAYQRAREVLEESWSRLGRVPLPAGDLYQEVAEIVAEGALAQRYAVVTQLLQKVVFPDSDSHRLRGIAGAPGSISSRSLAKRVVAPFDREHGAPLGGSGDPYVSNPLRRPALDQSMAVGPAAPLWESLLRVLRVVEIEPEIAPGALLVALAAMKEKSHDLQSLIGRVLQLQGTSGSDERRELVEHVAPEIIRPMLPDGFSVGGSSGQGRPAEVPWIRAFSEQESPSPQEGWYVAYLFSADGEVAYLALTQGVSASSVVDVERRATEVRERFAGRTRFHDRPDLRSRRDQGRPVLYERATALAKAYKAGVLPSAETLGADLRAMIRLLEEVYADEPGEELAEDAGALTVDAVIEAAAAEGIQLDADLAAAGVAAILAGQHVLLTGPPGTGKTSFAVALAKAASAAGISEGFELVTATADWTSAETIGAYWPEPEGEKLRFERGPVLEAIDRRAWLIIDELNRADIDKAFGPLFTVLSGHAARLPLHEESGGRHLPVEIVPPGKEASGDTAPHVMARQWRLIATLNTRDRDLLFSLSYALLRRFAVIDVPAPPREAMEEILEAHATTGDEELDARVARLAALPGRELGPAILIDCGAYLRERRVVVKDGGADLEKILAEAISSFVLPQLDDLSRLQQAEVLVFLQQRVLPAWSRARVAGLLAPTFQVSAEELVALAGAAEESEEGAAAE